MALLMKEESEQMAELLSKLGIPEPVSIETLSDLTKVLPKVKKEKKEIKKERLSFRADNIEDDDDENDEKGKGKTTVLPKLTWFCGQTPIPKSHVSFEAWKHEVEGLMKLYDKQVVIQSIRCSLRSPAAEVVWRLGMEASYEDIMDALKTQYDDITETEALLSELFSTIQGEKEAVAEFGGRLLSIAYKIRQSQGDKGGRDDEFVQQNFF